LPASGEITAQTDRQSHTQHATLTTFSWFCKQVRLTVIFDQMNSKTVKVRTNKAVLIYVI